MAGGEDLERVSSMLARRALLVTLSLAFAGASLGLVATRLGMVAGHEVILVCCSMLFSSGALVTLLSRKVALQTIATMSTSFFAINLCAGVLIAVCGSGERLNLFVYLLWFFPLLVFNKLVNQPAVGRLLAGILLAGPMLLLLCLIPRMRMVLRANSRSCWESIASVIVAMH